MSTIIAALDATAAARPVLETALRIGEMTGAEVQALHVTEGPTDTPVRLAQRSAVRFSSVAGAVDRALLGALEEEGVAAVVMGARGTTGGKRPVGHHTLAVVEASSKPVVVVPPEAVSPRRIRRLLVPLEGELASSIAVSEALTPLVGSDVELIVLHVFTDATLPRMLDRPVRDMEVLGDEFLADHLPYATAIELRTGPVSRRVIEVSREKEADLVVLAWSQSGASDRAGVVHDVLCASTIPVVLLPNTSENREQDGTLSPEQFSSLLNA